MTFEMIQPFAAVFTIGCVIVFGGLAAFLLNVD